MKKLFIVVAVAMVSVATLAGLATIGLVMATALVSGGQDEEPDEI